MSSLVEKFKKHWLVSLLVLCAVVAATTWKVCDQLLVRPRDFAIEQLRLEVGAARPSDVTTTEPAIVFNDGIPNGAAATGSDGVCNVAVTSDEASIATLTVTVGAADPEVFAGLHAGSRVVAGTLPNRYAIDVLRFRGGMTDVTISRLR